MHDVRVSFAVRGAAGQSGWRDQRDSTRTAWRALGGGAMLANRREPPMGFEDVMGAVTRWTTATEALAALGAQLSLQQSGRGSPEIVAALHTVSEAAGLGDLTELDPQPRAMFIAMARLYLRQSVDLLEHADAAPGWTYTDETILEDWGRVSIMVPASIATAHTELAQLDAFLDVGTGVGQLVMAAARVWPQASIVGVDVWEPSLKPPREYCAREPRRADHAAKPGRARDRRCRHLRLRVRPDLLSQRNGNH
jgi:hypothetical protein